MRRSGLGMILAGAAAILLFALVVHFSVRDRHAPLGFLGLEFAPLTPAAAARTPLLPHGGALVRDVAADSPAARAGIRPGEVVSAIGGTSILSARQASDLVRRHRAGDRIRLTLFDITHGEVHPRKLTLAFEPLPPATKRLSVRPPRTLAKEYFPPPGMAANAAWSRRIERGATIRPLALIGLGAGRCNGFAPEGWRVAAHARDDSMLHIMAGEGFAHALFQSGRLGGRDADAYLTDFLSRTFGSRAVLTPERALPFGYVVRDFGNARGGAGFVLYRARSGRIALWLAAVPGADAAWARPLVGAVALSLTCAAPGAPAPRPRPKNLPATSVSTRCLDDACRESDLAGSYLTTLRYGYVHNAKGEMFLVKPKRDLWETGPEGPGFYRQRGGANEKLEPGRLN
jgi:hypothetical protein